MLDALHPALGPLPPSEAAFLLQLTLRFPPIEQPTPPGDYLEVNSETPQPFTSFRQFNLFTPARSTIYLLPLTRAVPLVFLEQLGAFIEAFYLGAKFKLLEAMDLRQWSEKVSIRRRDIYPREQFCTQDLLSQMRSLVPQNAYAVMGVTDEDLYPKQNSTFVFGWAQYVARVGVFSYCRWDEQFFHKEKQSPDFKAVLYPALRTMTHEIGHMFGISHCVFYRCMMSGFHSIFENYRAPFEFCPVCFRKLVSNLAFNPALRYQALLGFAKLFGLEQQVGLYSDLLEISRPLCDGWEVKARQSLMQMKANAVASMRSPSNQKERSQKAGRGSSANRRQSDQKKVSVQRRPSSSRADSVKRPAPRPVKKSLPQKQGQSVQRLRAARSIAKGEGERRVMVPVHLPKIRLRHCPPKG